MAGPISDEDMDAMVLEALKAIADSEDSAQIAGRTMYHVTPRNRRPVAQRIVDELQRRGKIPPFYPVLQLAVQIAGSVVRQIEGGLLIRDGASTSENTMYWLARK